jgi:hypothetical protein
MRVFFFNTFHKSLLAVSCWIMLKKDASVYTTKEPSNLFYAHVKL